MMEAEDGQEEDDIENEEWEDDEENEEEQSEPEEKEEDEEAKNSAGENQDEEEDEEEEKQPHQQPAKEISKIICGRKIQKYYYLKTVESFDELDKYRFKVGSAKRRGLKGPITQNTYSSKVLCFP
jgi:hypothetical protein